MENLQRLKARHREIARLLVAGRTVTEISKILNMTITALNGITKTPLFQQLYGNLTLEADANAVDIRKRINELLPKAIEVSADILDRTDVELSLKQKTAWDILDRGGFGATKAVVFDGNITSSVEDLADSDIVQLVKDLDAKLAILTNTPTAGKELAVEASTQPAVSK